MRPSLNHDVLCKRQSADTDIDELENKDVASNPGQSLSTEAEPAGVHQNLHLNLLIYYAIYMKPQ